MHRLQRAQLVAPAALASVSCRRNACHARPVSHCLRAPVRSQAAGLRAQVLAQNGGTGWDLLTKLVVFEPGKRLSAAAALRHPWFGAGLLGSVAQALDRVGSSMGDVSNAQYCRAGCQQSLQHFGCNFTVSTTITEQFVDINMRLLHSHPLARP